MPLSSYKQLEVYQLALDLIVVLHDLTSRFPADELFGLKSQLMRAAYSVPMNIAEGYGRGSRKDYAQFIAIARGSLFEVDAGLDVAQHMGYIMIESAASLGEQVSTIGKMLTRLRTKLLSISHGATN
jgi:four helix bundle protein